MKNRLQRLVALTAALALGLTVTAGIGPSAQAADPAGAIDCELNGFVVKDPTLLADGGNSGDGHFGAANIAGTAVNSSVACAGSIFGTASVAGSFNWCPNAHGSGSFTCNGATGHHTGPDELLYPSVFPTNVHVVGKGTLNAQSSLVPLQRASDGQVYPLCNFSFEGHALAPPTLHVKLTCGDESYVGEATTTFVPVLGDQAGDLFQHSGHPRCAGSSASGPQCFRAVIFTGDIELRKLPV